MRWLMWLVIGFTAACAAGVYLLSGWWLLLVAACCMIALCALLAFRTPLCKKLSYVLLGCVISFLWLWCFEKIYLLPVCQLDGQTRSLQIRVTDYSRPSASGLTADGKIEIDGKTHSVQFYINENTALAPGDMVEGVFSLRCTAGGKENPTYHRGNGVFLLCYPKEECNVFPQSFSSVSIYPAIWKHKILSFMDRIFPSDTAGFAKALLLGETEDLSFDSRWSLKTGGVYHIVAVSGLHVSILFALVNTICLKRRVLTALIGLPVLFLFAAIAGFSPSVVRACIMQGLVIIALLADKEYDPPTALATAVLIMLARNPWAITSVSFQLSVGCVLGMLLFSGRIHNYLLKETKLGPANGKTIRSRISRWIVKSASVSLGTMAITVPLCVIWFDNMSIICVISNLLILWLIGIIFYGIMAACVLGVIWPPLGIAVGWIFSWLIRGVLWLTDILSELPVASVYTGSVYVVAWLIFCYIIVFAFIRLKKKQPVLLACCILVGLVITTVCAWLEPRLDHYRITALDVGQGQCILLQKDGKNYMVDCGGDSDDLAADKAVGMLRSQGVFRLDGLIITHFDADHAGGAPGLLNKIPADTIYLPVTPGENAIRDALIQNHSDAICWVEEDMALTDTPITIFAAMDFVDGNESSLCILFQPEECDILITGDRSAAGEQALIANAELPDVEILIAGHHGSRDSTSWELLNETRPEIVIISVGDGNYYGHPNRETLNRLKLFGCGIYRTDREGTIIFRG